MPEVITAPPVTLASVDVPVTPRVPLNVELPLTVKLSSIVAVSYTHLTLPTK